MPRSKFGKMYKHRTLERAYLIVKESEDGLICEEIVQKISDNNITVGRLSQWLRSDNRYQNEYVRPFGDSLKGQVFKYTIRDD